MSKEEHIENKINEISDDDKLANNILLTTQMFNEIKIDYSMLGSCGIQTYFDYFLRLPNDLDILIHYENLYKIKDYCDKHNYDFFEQLGRTKIIINELPIHIIPEKLNSIDKVTNKIFTRIDLSKFISKSQIRKVRLLNGTIDPEVHVFPLEVNLFVELIRPIYTGSLMNIFFIFKCVDIDKKLFKELFNNNPDLKEIVLYRLKDYPSKILKLTYFQKEDLQIVIEKINAVTNFLS